MNLKRLKYENIINTNIKQISSDKDGLIKVREGLSPELRHSLGAEINSKINLLEKQINDLSKELCIVTEDSIEAMKKLLNKKEKELIYINEVINRMVYCENVSASEYVNALVDTCGDSIKGIKGKLILDIDVIREDINKMVVMEALNIKAYDIDTVFIVEKNKENKSERDIKTRDGYFFVCIDEKNVLVLVKDEENDNTNSSDIQYEKKLNYKDRNIYIGVKHSIPPEQLPF